MKFSGIIQCVWGPLFVKLKQRLDRCAIGYIEIMLNVVYDTDYGLITNNASYLRLVFKVFANLYQMQLPIIHDKRLRKTFVETIGEIKPGEERLSNGSVNYRLLNKFFTKISNDLNDSL